MNSSDHMTAISPDTGGQSNAPAHVAIIMDGNGRWAKSRNLPRVAGHKRGAAAVKTAIKSAITAGVRHLTLFGFSSENWKRSKSEIKDLMGLLRFYLKSEISVLHREGVRFSVIGDRTRLDDDIVKLIEEAENLTRANTRLSLFIALSYGGRAEITKVAKVLAAKVKAGEIEPADIDEELFANHLYTSDIPDPDILIRTSGEQRISNFLLWQLAYAEFIFLDTLWPDFSQQDFDDAIELYHGRERRYGATGD
jgi:undecaprenyl diphosphate synthase